MWRAGTAMLPSSSVPSTRTDVRSVSSESEAVICSSLPLRTKRKFSRMGNADFAGMAFDTSIMPLSSSALETVNFISKINLSHKYNKIAGNIGTYFDFLLALSKRESKLKRQRI